MRNETCYRRKGKMKSKVFPKEKLKMGLALTVLMILTISLVASVFFIHTAEAASPNQWLTGWNYRKNITINPATGAGTDYQVKIDAYYGGDQLADSRFTNFVKSADNPLSIPNYGAYGVVHPDVIYFANGMDGYKYWMVYTPFPPDDPERPCIVRSNDGINWVDTGITNPVVNGGGKNNADPAMIYVPALGKWFMVYDQYFDSNTEVTPNLAYSDDGKTWTINIALIDGLASYEKNNLGKIWCGTPTLLYEDGWFYIWYDCPGGTATETHIALAKFQWDNAKNEITGLERNSVNPVLYPPQDSEFEAGSWSHIDVSSYNGVYYMYIVRTMRGTTDYELALFTSTDKVSWTNQGKALARGPSGQWDDKDIYRSSPVTDGTGTLVFFDGQIKLIYSAFSAASGYPKIGYATSVPISNDGVDLAGKCRTDFGDVRFTDDDGTTPLNYWMESKVDSNSAVFWVKVADSLESQAQTIYVYYGKADATTTSNGANTFLFFDDFSGDLSKWTTLEGTVSIESGQMKVSAAPGSYSSVRSNSLLPCSARLEVKATFSDTRDYSRISRANSYSLSSHLPYVNDAAGFDCWSDGKYYTDTYNGGSGSEFSDGAYNTNAHTYELLTVSGSSCKFYVDNVLITSEHTTDVPNDDMWNFFQAISRTLYVDDVRLGKYVSPEPSISAFGMEEQLTGVIQSSNSAGTQKDTFNPGETIYTYGTGFSPSTSLKVYVVIHQDVWNSGDSLNDLSGGPTSATTDASGNLQATSVWSHANPGLYDIIVDANNNGRFEAGEAKDCTDVTPGGPGGFFVVPEYALGGLAALGACFVGFVVFKKRSSFSHFKYF